MSAGDGVRAIVVAVDGDHEMVVGRVVAPRLDMAVVHGLARMRLVSRRLGWEIRLRRVCPELCELLDLVGLADLLVEGLGLEVGREAEDGEQAGVEEVVDPGDPPV